MTSRFGRNVRGEVDGAAPTVTRESRTLAQSARGAIRGEGLARGAVRARIKAR
jgi:hypothetical protein